MVSRQSKCLSARLEAQFNVLRAIEANPSLSQREISRQLGMSLGKANYCVQALLREGLIKSHNYKNENNKIAYSYTVTQRGMEEKLRLAVAFLNEKQRAFDLLRSEIKQLQQETIEK
ncbi:MarR family EPS-associated transcriptional regulator [Granulosicoccus sp. 3-233]|uniref:MarR family EPS-associated transcriptional regulator n=1 Tax=Granulosicoccus sp. 3-233 TaxID=3417969 RepID=UPI003D34360E